VSVAAAERIRKQIEDAVAAGAKLEMPEIYNHTFIGPQVLTNVNHEMSIMRDETFGPVVGIMKVSSDEEAIALMNDSEFGLTASIWTTNRDGKAEELADQLEAGTIFINRLVPSDYADSDPTIPIRRSPGLASKIREEDAHCRNLASLSLSDTTPGTTSLVIKLR